MEKYFKATDVEAILNKLNTEPAYQHSGEDFYCGVSAVECEVSSLSCYLISDVTKISQ